ncbi:hypothetical protein RND81_09G052400 [Saponaria officinalis]|uniref:Uncharacterized protein n=1 Tax=Saponaria officinalis TaxID=3572 RepID=A0AAW1II70_SAPOF
MKMSDQPSHKTLNSSSSSSTSSTVTATAIPNSAVVTVATVAVDSDQPPLTRNSSFNKLNAKAPEFIPMKPTQSPPPPSPSSLVIVPPPPPPPPLVHVFAPIPVPGVHPPPLPHHFQQLQPQIHDQHRLSNHNKKHGSKEQIDKDQGNLASQSNSQVH